MFWKIKIVLAVILLISIFMPLGSCERKQIPKNEQTQTSPQQERSPTAPQSTNMERSSIEYLVPIKFLELSEPSTWLFLVTFVWPLPFLAIKGFLLKSKWKRRIGNLLEFLLSGFSAYVIYSFVFTLFYEPMTWGYIATLAMSLYLMVHLAEVLIPYLAYNRKMER
ncbi:MAG: hypothetical protein FJ110_18870 [Deltaproteobacteria bacterium]|nr:hypothetical protein [Deltaproteobacteria bacterium]